jgi:hypothetical protein
MKTNEKYETIPGWHCVEFQRKVREEMSELKQRDPQEYDRQLKEASAEFWARRKAREEQESKKEQ